MKFVLVTTSKEQPICYLPRTYTLKGKVIKNIAQKISKHHSPLLKVNPDYFNLLQIGKKEKFEQLVNEKYGSKEKELERKLLLSIYEKYDVFQIGGRAYKNMIFFGWFKKINSDSFSDIKRKFIFYLGYKDEETQKFEKFYIEKEYDGKLPLIVSYEKTFYEFQDIFYSSLFTKIPELEKGGVKTYLNKIQEDIEKFKEYYEQNKNPNIEKLMSSEFSDDDEETDLNEE